MGLLLHRRGEAAAEIALIHGGVIAVPSVPGVGVLIMAGKGPVRLDGDLGGPGPRAAGEDKGLGQLGEQVLLGLLCLGLRLARVGLLRRVWVLSLLGVVLRRLIAGAVAAAVCRGLGALVSACGAFLSG